MRFEVLTFKNIESKVYSKYRINREEFDVVKVTFERKDSEIISKIIDKSEKLAQSVNIGEANSSLSRNEGVVQIDALTGVIAEEVCVQAINAYNNDLVAQYTPYINSLNQIDIKLANGQTIEVRSSCIRNGVDFALFSKDKRDYSKQYLDVLGPYANGYKLGEVQKDYYMRVIYHCNKMDFDKHFRSDEFAAYIVGGATVDMMNNTMLYQIKDLIPEGEYRKNKTKYRVIPIGKALDAMQFLKLITANIEIATELI